MGIRADCRVLYRSFDILELSFVRFYLQAVATSGAFPVGQLRYSVSSEMSDTLVLRL